MLVWSWRKTYYDQNVYELMEKYMSDYQLMEWNEDTFDIYMNAWVEQAYESRNFAFVADYVRFYALSKWGGVYLDTDILIKKNMDRFLNASFFSVLEFPLIITSLNNIILQMITGII